MTFSTHLIAGLVLGKITGNYSLSVGMALGIDIDHVFSYIKNGVLLNPTKFLKTILNKEDPYGDQRFLLHNVLVFVLLSIIILLINYRIGLIFSLAY